MKSVKVLHYLTLILCAIGAIFFGGIAIWLAIIEHPSAPMFFGLTLFYGVVTFSEGIREISNGE